MKTILITGAGTGIGAATARQLASHKDLRLVLAGRRLDKLQEVLALLPNPDRHTAVSMDISNPESIRQGLQSAGVSSLYGLFANAGVGGENTYGESDRWNHIIDINLSGTYYTVMECLPLLRRDNEAYTNVLITSSCLAKFGVPNYTAYCASKTGLLGMTRALAVELASEKILVNALCPGWVDTEMAREGIQLLADRAGVPYEEAYKEQMGYVPLGKMSTPEELGKVAEFYLTNTEVSTTGQSIDVNNGAFMI